MPRRRSNNKLGARRSARSGPGRFSNTQGFRSVGAMVATGERIPVPNDPPSIMLAPWNNITVELTISGTPGGFNITCGSVVTALSRQLEFPTAVDTYICVRIRAVKVWGGRSGEVPLASQLQVSQQLTLDTYPLDQALISNYSTQFSATDSPGAQRWPSIGYRFPLAQQTHTFTTGATNTCAKVSCLPPSVVLVRFELLWRANATFAPPPVSARVAEPTLGNLERLLAGY